MKPRVLKIDPDDIDRKALEQAAEVINHSGLVAFPTETVYGLGASALDPRAVTGIFQAKERPLDDPLIVHIADAGDLDELAVDVPRAAYGLIERFWPGPLTIVLKKSEVVPDLVSTGLETVALRMPSNPVARGLIELAGVPVAAPSANLFGRPSPTTASHVLEDLKGRIDVLLDGGKTDIGVESTVIELIGNEVILLRPGGVKIEDIEEIAGTVRAPSSEGEAEVSPGKYPQHYSPRALVVLCEDTSGQVLDARIRAERYSGAGKKVGLLVKEQHAGDYRGHVVKILGPENDAKTCASRLFHLLREFDAEGIDIIIAEGISEKGLGLAVMNRLRKAAGPDIVRG
ncbi:MAG: threonylcarbamoyl-AMP synthase [Candidatus Omnitrophica bacterium]|nr:threonylcarbamoyl-AMP synthase [Candidatus Omnitrophota bacterium]